MIKPLNILQIMAIPLSKMPSTGASMKIKQTGLMNSGLLSNHNLVNTLGMLLNGEVKDLSHLAKATNANNMQAGKVVKRMVKNLSTLCVIDDEIVHLSLAQLSCDTNGASKIIVKLNQIGREVANGAKPPFLPRSQYVREIHNEDT